MASVDSPIEAWLSDFLTLDKCSILHKDQPQYQNRAKGLAEFVANHLSRTVSLGLRIKIKFKANLSLNIQIN
jgi:DNA-binding transcriptional regulator LsrR (DeoR family)